MSGAARTAEQAAQARSRAKYGPAIAAEIAGLIGVAVQIVLADPESRASKALRGALAEIEPDLFADPEPVSEIEAAQRAALSLEGVGDERA